MTTKADITKLRKEIKAWTRWTAVVMAALMALGFIGLAFLVV